MPDALKGVLAALAAAACAVAAFFLSFAVTGELWLNLLAAAAAFAMTMWILVRNLRGRVPMVVAGVACLLAVAAAPSVRDRMTPRPGPESEDLVRQIGAAALRLRTVDAGSGSSDLEPLKTVWRGVRVVALGEATHGTSEFFRMKHRIAEFLVAQMGFRHIAAELDAQEARHVEAYIQGEASTDPVPSLSWPWATHEMSAMVAWMRRYNLAAPEAGRVHFHGIDYQGERRDFHMAQNTLGLLEDLGPQSSTILWSHNAHVSDGAGWMGWYLKQSLHNQIYLTGFEFHHGRFTSRMNWVRSYQAETAGNGYYAAALARVGAPILFLDFRSMAENPALAAWLDEPRLTHDLQEAHGFLRLNPAWVRAARSWPSLFDGVIYLAESTPAQSW